MSLTIRTGFDFIGLAGEMPAFTDDQIKDEPMLFRCDRETARRLGGPITHAWLDMLAKVYPWDRYDLSIDTRSHMLMPGWFPAIPGWHHDAVPRTRADGQPNYQDPARFRHALTLANGDIAPTNFACGFARMSDPEQHAQVYRTWHEEVEAQIAAGTLRRDAVPSGRLILFDDRDFHEATRAVKRGWRWFGRATHSDSGHPLPIRNETRRQVQVYLENPMEGW